MFLINLTGMEFSGRKGHLSSKDYFICKKDGWVEIVSFILRQKRD